jgi:hypothetical protein
MASKNVISGGHSLLLFLLPRVSVPLLLQGDVNIMVSSSNVLIPSFAVFSSDKVNNSILFSSPMDELRVDIFHPAISIPMGEMSERLLFVIEDDSYRVNVRADASAAAGRDCDGSTSCAIFSV